MYVIRTQLWLRPYSGSHILSRRCSGKGCYTKNVQSALSGNQQVDNVDGPLTKLIACEISVFVNFYISSHRQRKIKRAFQLGKKTRKFRWEQKLFHLVVNPVTWRCPTVDLLRYKLRQTRKRKTKFRSEFPTGKTGPSF